MLKLYVTILRHRRSVASDALIGYNTVQQRKRIDMFIIARMRITPRRLLVGCCRMLYRTRIVGISYALVVESHSNRTRIAIGIPPKRACTCCCCCSCNDGYKVGLAPWIKSSAVGSIVSLLAVLFLVTIKNISIKPDGNRVAPICRIQYSTKFSCLPIT